MENLCLSLVDMLGSEYVDAVCRASSSLGLGDEKELQELGREKVEFWPEAYAKNVAALLERIGDVLCEPFADDNTGAPTDAFGASTHLNAAPLSGMGPYRLQEDGRLAIIGKSEHYQASLGQNFPGYQLLILAQRIGITNVTHNNTRGFITRKLERELIRTANGLSKDDVDGLAAVLSSRERHVLNRVINLETGSLACEAALKMMLARFYKLQPHFEAPKYHGRTPVFFVMGDLRGGTEANYHGTTVVTQLFRSMWNELYAGMEAAGLLKVVPVPINDADAFEKLVEQYDGDKTKVAGFFHELVLMNYGGIRLTDDYIRRTDAICDAHDIPVMVDEIQTGLWSPELFLFREYNSRPDFVTIGKGFPGGQYPASKILTTSELDNLNQFGALVTNGQEEIASLAYLVTMAFAEANKAHTAEMGRRWETALKSLAERHPQQIVKAEGYGLMGTLFFRTAEAAANFGHAMGGRFAVDVSAQTYKADCPPAALTKLPLIVDAAMIDRIAKQMELLLQAEQKA
ncbi:MAG: aminotransferase class III-fold pyridoxal phosphate-dependent enzyme [Lentisphaeria bacterium]|nr:aminotransferase class III-fold pyridoxal phosphate-dependent enzyme [Lentisphaeria bacterium]